MGRCIGLSRLRLGCGGTTTATSANDQDQLCQYGDYDYVYNARGQLESRTDGALTTDYTYDGLGRLKRVTEPGMDIHYVHDALGRRIGKIRDGNLEKGWLYKDALNPIAQLDSSGTVEATFLYGSRAHVPDAVAMADGTTYRLITDHLGSVRLVVNAETGQVVQRMDYDAFGRVLNDTNPGFQPFGFAGGLYDDDTGLVRFGARDYDAYSGRWTAKDPILFGAGATNLYQYVNGNPVNLIDPTGLDEVQDIYRAAYETCWAIRSPAFRNWGPISGVIANFVPEAPVCSDYASEIADCIATIVNMPGAGAFPVWSFEGPTEELGEFVRNNEPRLFDSHATVQVYETGGDGSVNLVDEYDPWLRPW